MNSVRPATPGGVYVFTTWCGPDVSPLFRIVPEAIQAHGKMNVGLPPAPPPFRLADRTESMRAMAAAGFGEVSFVDVPAVFECKRDEVIDFLEKSTVRLTMLLQAQSSAARAAIYRAIREKLATFAAGDTLRLPLPAILVRGVKRADNT